MDRMIICLMTYLSDARDNERGAAGVEYGILVAAIAAVIVVLAITLGGKIAAAFQTVVSALP